MAYSASDYLNATLALLPRGRFWAKEQLSNMSRTLALFMPSIQRLSNRAEYLLVDSFPLTTTELLPTWEATLGLPDPCQGEAPTYALRRAQVVQRLTGIGGQTIQYYVDVAAQLGFEIDIAQGQTFRAGFSSAGQGCGDAYAYVWTVTAPTVSIQYFRAGQGTAGDPLQSWGNDVLECVLRELAPSHTLVRFQYVDHFTLDHSQLDSGAVLT